MGKHKFKILSLDGGGIKGIIPCKVLMYIERKTGKKISSLFNMLAGTSTGGIIALGLTKPKKQQSEQTAYTAEDMLNLYVKHGKDIFSKRENDLKSWLGAIIEKGLFDKSFDVANFEELLKEKFGDTRLKESLADVLVTTYEPQIEKPFYYSSRLAKEREDENEMLRIIARSTSAAPTFFKPAKATYQNKEMAFVDGGVFANNPSVLAYGEAKEIWKKTQKTITVTVPPGVNDLSKTITAEVAPDDHDLPFFMLSLGCGHHPAAIDLSGAGSWRTNQWIKPLLTNVFMQSVSESTHYTMQYLMPDFVDGTKRYIRLDDINLKQQNSEMDNTSAKNIGQLVDIADNYIASHQQQLDEICRILMNKI
jgi:patatin-like phospholipase/acyl hydrolase